MRMDHDFLPVVSLIIMDDVITPSDWASGLLDSCIVLNDVGMEDWDKQ